jgi:hypothetical protein
LCTSTRFSISDLGDRIYRQQAFEHRIEWAKHWIGFQCAPITTTFQSLSVPSRWFLVPGRRAFLRDGEPETAQSGALCRDIVSVVVARERRIPSLEA